MTKNGVESENEFDVDEPEEVKKDELKPQSNSRRQSTRLRVSRVPVILDTGSTDDDLSDEDSDFEKLIPKKRMRGSVGGVRGGGRSRGRQPSKAASVSSTTTNGQPDIEAAGSEDNSNTAHISGSDTEPTSTTTNSSSLANQTPIFQSGAFVVSKKDFKKLSDPPIWKIDGKALLQKFIPFELDGKTFYKNTSVYSGWSNSTKHKYYPCSIVFKQQSKKEHVIQFLKDKIVPDENYVYSESEAEGDNGNEDDDDEEDVANGFKKEKNNDNDDEEEEDEEEEELEEDNDDDDDDDDNGEVKDEDDDNGEVKDEDDENGEVKAEEGKESDENPVSEAPKE